MRICLRPLFEKIHGRKSVVSLSLLRALLDVVDNHEKVVRCRRSTRLQTHTLRR